MTEIKQIVKDVIRNFDFEKVHKAMIAVDWKWHTPNGVYIPKQSELVTRVTELLTEASGMDTECSVSSGGFTATKLHDDENGEGLSLEFTLALTVSYENE